MPNKLIFGQKKKNCLYVSPSHRQKSGNDWSTWPSDLVELPAPLHHPNPCACRWLTHPPSPSISLWDLPEPLQQLAGMLQLPHQPWDQRAVHTARWNRGSASFTRPLLTDRQTTGTEAGTPDARQRKLSSQPCCTLSSSRTAWTPLLKEKSDLNKKER